MFKKVLDQGGALISERLWDQEPRPYDFPIRNRIISGICSTTLVMDAHLKSGSLITAQRALEQGRDVMVLRSTRNSLNSSGTKLLMDEGSPTFSSSKEVLENLISQRQGQN